MKKIFLVALVALPGFLLAQQKESDKNAERIIITKKGNSNEKLNIVIDGEKITLNGKPLSEDENATVSVKKLKIKDLDNFSGSPSDLLNNRIQQQIWVGGAPNKAMLGVTTEKAEEGVVVKSVTNESAAEKAGLKEGDIITAVDAKKIETPTELSEALKNKEPGDKVRIAYLRNGKKATAAAELTKWKAPDTIIFNGPGNGAFDMSDIFEGLQRNPQGFNNDRNLYFRSTPALGFTASGPQLGIKVQDVETGSGVKVLSVEKDSDAGKAGLREGDIIKAANEVSVHSTDDLLAQKRKARAGSTMVLKVDRNGKTQTIDILFSKKIKTADL